LFRSNLAISDASLLQSIEEERQSIGVKRISGLSQVARQDTMLGADRTNCTGVVGKSKFLILADQAVIHELDEGPHGGCLLHIIDRHMNRCHHGVGDDNASHTLRACVSYPHPLLLRRAMASGPAP